MIHSGTHAWMDAGAALGPIHRRPIIAQLGWLAGWLAIGYDDKVDQEVPG
jgi:hypothetical protein